MFITNYDILRARNAAGKLSFFAKIVIADFPKKRMLAGMGAVPQDRRGAGLVLPFSIEENLLIGASDLPPFNRNGFLDSSAVHLHGEQLMESFDIRAPGPLA
ncbi:MAG: hypothetical protein ACLQHM_06000, partial [Limisphaerales bacterium]